MGAAHLRRPQLVWAGLLLVLCCGTAAALTPVEGVRAGAIAFQGMLFMVFASAVPLSALSNHAPLPRRVVLVNGAIVLASCVWTLTFPQDQTEGTFAPLPSLLGSGALSGSQAVLHTNVAWACLLLCIVLGLVNWRMCRAEKRRQEDQQTT